MHSIREEHEPHATRTLLTRALRCSAVAGLALTVAAGGAVLKARPAHAAATGCNKNVCMHLSSPKNGKVTIEAWADDSCFTGNFDLTGPSGLYIHRGNQTYCPGDRPHPVERFENVGAVVGKYCIAGFSNGKLQGKPCESIE
jgi:hypothetical protein